MTDTGVRLDNIDEDLISPIGEYADLLQKLGGDTVRSLTLFGIAATMDFDPRVHVARNVVEVSAVDLDFVRSLSLHGARLGKLQIAAPLIMTRDYIDASRDTFPLELIDISKLHVTVLGDDPFVGLEFDDAHVRLQCERELKALLIGLRQGLLAAAGRDNVLEAVELDAGEGLIRTLRGLLWLKGDRDIVSPIALVEAAESRFDRRFPGIRDALSPSARHDWDTFKRLYADVEALAGMADAL